MQNSEDDKKQSCEFEPPIKENTGKHFSDIVQALADHTEQLLIESGDLSFRQNHNSATRALIDKIQLSISQAYQDIYKLINQTKDSD